MITVGLIVLGLIAAIVVVAWCSSRRKTPAALSTGTRASDTVPIWMLAGASETKACADQPGDAAAGNDAAGAGDGGGCDGGGGSSN